MKLKVAVVQMDCVPGDKAANMAKAEAFVQQAAQQGARLIVLPELFSTGYRLDELYYQYSEDVPGGDTVNHFSQIAKDRKVYIVGCIGERSEHRGLCHDTAFLVGPDGYLGKVRKIELWNLEKLYFTPGNLDDRKPFETDFGKLGITICYEAGFPEISRRCAAQGADIVVETSALGKPRYYAWDLLTRARALENGCFVLVADRIGKEKDSEFCGLSRIISPRGEILAEAGPREAVVVHEIDLDDIAKQRASIPYLRDYITWLKR